MSIFRSTQMKFYNVQIPKQYVYDVVRCMGQLDLVQIIDSNPTELHKPYVNNVKRCEQALRKIQILNKIMNQHNCEILAVQQTKEFLSNHEQILRQRNKNPSTYLDQIQDSVSTFYKQIDNLEKNKLALQQKIRSLQDYKTLLYRAREIFYSQNQKQSDLSLNFQFKLLSFSGIIQTENIHRFAKIIFRSTKGNSLVYTFDIPSLQSDKSKRKSIYIIMIEGGNAVFAKVNRICQSFQAKKYTLPDNKNEYLGKITEIDSLITDTRQLLGMTEKQLKQNLGILTARSSYDFCNLECSKIEQLRLSLLIQKTIYDNMNRLDNHSIMMVAQIWIPQEKFKQLYAKLPSVVNIRQKNAKTTPPTHFEINQFTYPFQQIVNTYGTPRYGQVNPGLFAISIFPFLFGIMFGDIGHGGVLLTLAILLCRSPKRMLPDLYKIRYLLLLMGIFAFYAGWIYNDFFSIPLNIFGSCYENEGQYAKKIPGCVYPFGLDPKWISAENQLNFFNSFKMKFAVILGVVQMSFAVFLKMINTVHFGSYLDFFFEWIPQQVFLFTTFGYMCILIIKKWTIPWGLPGGPLTSQAPSIIGQMIALPLKLGSTQDKPLWDQTAQQQLQLTLLKISVIAVPLMLIPKPLFIYLKDVCLYKKPSKKQRQITEDNFLNELRSTLVISEAEEETHHDQEHQFSEIVVHQIIETIQFVLNSISNTASYLRLWALSLAHSQLSRVFFQKTLGEGITHANILLLLFGFWFFFNITFGVIMCMDSMQCFLHALRLQWVQFQNKFYKADGWKFEPISYVEIVENNKNVLQ